MTGTEGQPGRVAYLDGRRLRRLLLAGIGRLTAERAHLDRINVFPVPDGDTGTNLALTFAAVAERVADLDTRHAGELLAVAADAALDGSRGNSGAILTAYLQGLATALSDRARINPRELGPALATASMEARSAIQNPQEGTVLSAMAAAATAATPDRLPVQADFLTLLEQVLDRTRQAVTATRDTLDAQRSAGVEDAGALGFLTLLEGMAGALAPGLAPPLPATAGQDLAQAAHADGIALGASVHRYCTECLVTGGSLDPAALRRELEPVASSVVVVGSGRKLRLHAHVDDPAVVFAIARRHGSVQAEKADDMYRQERALAADGRRVAIVTDSGADLPPEIWDDFGIHVVPLRVNFGTRSYLDKTGLPPAEFYRELRHNPEHPRTSQPPPGDFRRAFELLSSHFEAVVAISLTRRLSGTHQAARNAADRVANPDRITVVDSRSASAGQGLVVLAAAEAARSGLGPAEVAAVAAEAASRTRTYGFIPDLRYAVRGGRIGAPWSWLARILPLCFVVATNPEGGIGVRRVALRGTDPVGLLVRAARRDLERDGSVARRIAIAHGDVPELAGRLKAGCATGLGEPRATHITELGPAFAVHGGPGTVALAVQT